MSEFLRLAFVFRNSLGILSLMTSSFVSAGSIFPCLSLLPVHCSWQKNSDAPCGIYSGKRYALQRALDQPQTFFSDLAESHSGFRGDRRILSKLLILFALSKLRLWDSGVFTHKVAHRDKTWRKQLVDADFAIPGKLTSVIILHLWKKFFQWPGMPGQIGSSGWIKVGRRLFKKGVIVEGYCSSIFDSYTEEKVHKRIMSSQYLGSLCWKCNAVCSD